MTDRIEPEKSGGTLQTPATSAHSSLVPSDSDKGSSHQNTDGDAPAFGR